MRRWQTVGKLIFSPFKSVLNIERERNLWFGVNESEEHRMDRFVRHVDDRSERLFREYGRYGEGGECGIGSDN